MWPRQPALFALIFLLITVLMACQPGRASPTLQPNEVEVPFETVELGQPVTDEKTWTDPAPGLLVVVTVAEIDKVRPYVSDEAAITLDQLDFARYFALLAFDGWKSEGYQGFQIQQVVRQGDQVSIVAQPSHKPGDVATGVETSLYHLIKISRNGQWAEWLTFNLYFENAQTAVASVEHYVP